MVEKFAYFLELVLLLTFHQQLCSSSQPKYHIATYPSNWFEAAEYCHRMGMRLAIVDSEERHNAVVREAKAAELHSSGYFGVWLGATDLARAKNFVWHSTGARVQFSRWRIFEPSGGDEHCLGLYYWPLRGFIWTWNDASCDKELYAICESTDRESCSHEF